MSRRLKSRRFASSRQLGLVLAVASFAISPTGLEGQWLDSIPSINFGQTASFELPADPPHTLPDSLVRGPEHRLEWAFVGAIVTGVAAWCTFDFMCAGENDYGRTRFTLSAAALGAVAGYVFGERLFGRSPATTDPQPPF